MPIKNFKTAYTGRKAQHAPSGNRIQKEYGYEINKFGQKVLVQTGETDLYSIIQESLEETKIENILKRVAIGDNSVLRPEGIYADLTEAPKNLLEARQQMQQLENTWNDLPIETKRKYNFDVEQFIANAGNENWLRDMGLLKEKPTEEPITTPEPETKTTGE